MKFVVSTRNKGKLPEIKAALEPFGYEVVSLSEAGLGSLPEVPESGETFAQNARIKAYAVYEICGLPTLADDSGLMVDALDGRPGIYSARYADGDDAKRRAKLLDEMKDVPEEERSARFVCSICAILDNGKTIEVAGVIEGRIATEERGTNGFGFDSLFIPEGYEQTFGELSAETKDKISHRARALAALAAQLKGAEE